MDHYLDIRVLSDPEFSAQALLEALFAKLHRALVATTQGRVGVSFPGAGKTLGSQLRVHGRQCDLVELQSAGWLKGLRDYCECSEIFPIPAVVKYRVIRRVQVKSNVERLRRRSVSKGWLTEEEARLRIPDSHEQQCNLPFLRLKSLSSAQHFLLFVEQGKLQETPVTGVFSAYGLSTNTTIPWF
ncbi:type I-F CRISPR-associated endoribonuclease Cas6/Csy4 [Yersinia pekkanenii]|uniref:CRISPR-associated protein, Csy4 family n=1 Tax=Yersinia pekkanenii TaxID=1288385 RepID=A0A0T9Q819_9GAMM|nr:type I-F CRISPR-associated endoribonuclease Cas6/Csy4 [Yersinia pekkanenii]CNH98488.1 CRISPR-associated protein%2C Csy4 family [Yersinia pekkanenii]CRY65111.1 CRISPR-associated protein%2C Csy4 family [Yersinia pekkanenii]